MLDGMLERMWDRDEALARHGFRVAVFTTSLSAHLHLPAETTDRLRIAAMIHDIGKLKINPDIIGKPGPLDELEWEEMRKHPQHGFEMVEQFVHADIASILISHHERFDGTGYPYRRAGREIPRGARILLVADAFDAMTSNRPYQPAIPMENALRELELHAGSQFDPEVVEAMLDLGYSGVLSGSEAALSA